MSDNLTRYYAVSNALRQGAGQEPTGNHARHLRTLAHLVSGIVGSRRCQLGAIASKAPDHRQRESRIKRFTRWVQNARITTATYYRPYVQSFLSHLPQGRLVLVMDASVIGRSCMVLVLSVVYQKRALPLAWRVARGHGGHFPEPDHIPLLKEVARLLLETVPDKDVLFLGDAEFDSVPLLEQIQTFGWQFVCRTGKNIIVVQEGKEIRLSWLRLAPGACREMAAVLFTRKHFGPVRLVVVWEAGYQEPLYLVSNLEVSEDVLFWYRKRFSIETLFSDQKSRGFFLCHSHLSDPARLHRLLIAVCLAYVWMVCLGAAVLKRGRDWLSRIHRKSRCDLSLFQIGLHWLEHCLNEGYALTLPLHVPPERGEKSVR